MNCFLCFGLFFNGLYFNATVDTPIRIKRMIVEKHQLTKRWYLWPLLIKDFIALSRGKYYPHPVTPKLMTMIMTSTREWQHFDNYCTPHVVAIFWGVSGHGLSSKNNLHCITPLWSETNPRLAWREMIIIFFLKKINSCVTFIPLLGVNTEGSCNGSGNFTNLHI